MINLFKHQEIGAKWLEDKKSAALFWTMGTGKTRTVIYAARRIYEQRKIDRVLVLCPAAVQISWRSELAKIAASESFDYNLLRYDSSELRFKCEYVGGHVNGNRQHLPFAVVSYAMLQQPRHVKTVSKWAASGKTALICDESSFLKNRTAAQMKGSYEVASSCDFRWLLSGTPVSNSPLDLWAQAEVMEPARSAGPNKGFANWYAFRAEFVTLVSRKMGQIRFQEVVGYKNLDKLTKRWEKFVSRVEKKDCLDLPEKVFIEREVALNKETWRIYQEMKKKALAQFPDGEIKVEPNAAVRLMRLGQITSGHYGGMETPVITVDEKKSTITHAIECLSDISSEKIDWLLEQITEGELSGRVIVWCRWRRERERLALMLKEKGHPYSEICGDQTAKQRDEAIMQFETAAMANIPFALLAQPHAGGFGLNLQAASTAVFLSNDYSWATRMQAEDRIHRSGQTQKCVYIDVLAVGPDGQRTVDHVIFEALREKNDLATWTTNQWRKALDDE